VADSVLIIAGHAACLAPVFGESAVVRLARLALSLDLPVHLWLTPEIRQALGSEFYRLLGPMAPRVMTAAEMLEAARTWRPDQGKKILVLPATSVWDRLSLRQRLEDFAAPSEGGTSPFLMAQAELAEAVRACLENRLPRAGSNRGLLPFLLADASQGSLAEARLVQHLAASTQASDGLLARWVDRPLSRALSPHLARKRVPPNLITLAGMSLGLLGAWLLARAGYGPHLLGALLFWSAVVLDGVDGEVARLTLRESAFGHYLDIITDNLVHVAVFIGMAVGLYRDTGYSGHLYALAALILGFGLCAVAVYQVVGKKENSREAWSPLAAKLVKALNSRDFAYLVVLLAFINRLSWFLWGAAGGTYLFALGLWLLPRYHRARPS